MERTITALKVICTESDQTSIQVTPRIGQPYRIRRSLDDFSDFQKQFVKKLEKEFVVRDGTILHPILGKMDRLPVLPFTGSTPVLQKEIDRYLKRLMALPLVIIERAPIKDFFGRREKDTAQSYDMDKLVNTRSAPSSMTKKDVKANTIPRKTKSPGKHSPETKPTFEEFVQDLQKNLGVEKQESTLRHATSMMSVATVLDSPKSLKVSQSLDTIRRKPVATVRDTVIETTGSADYHLDTVIENTGSGDYYRDTIVEETLLLRSGSDRDTVIETKGSRSSLRDTYIENEEHLVAPPGPKLAAAELDLVDDIPKQDSDSQRKKASRKAAPMKINTALGPIQIPSRTDSRNWSSDCDSADRKTLKIISGDGTPTSATSLTPLSAGTLLSPTESKPFQKSTNSTTTQVVTLRIMLSQSTPLYLTIPRTIDFGTMLDKVSLLIAETPTTKKWRYLPPPRNQMVAVQQISYRTAVLDAVAIHNDKDWQECLYQVLQAQKLTLFVAVHEHKVL